jgi:hypothetical protein
MTAGSANAAPAINADAAVAPNILVMMLIVFLPVANAGTPCVIRYGIKPAHWVNRQLVFHEFL